ncbi:hypothetical protein [Paraflavitalea pollutisoli]|uniref:hypothetical protein n=1 Tax=Paraflavitalea pollutisoli TaxID=3034143 RepID=UPI0023EB3015|nr:hypothetical protein [Paraflavitalea sp. H1-2-19X]
MKKIDITEEALLADGWTLTGDESIVAEKVIENRNPLNASEDSEIKLIIHNMYNQNAFAVLLPDGGMLNFIANSMKDLQAFERAIDFYDPPF